MKLFMLADTMDIGGAETHIYELSRLLSLQGHTVTVLSAGGRTANELERAGVRHITIPSPAHAHTMPAALSAIAAHIRREKPDIVHAHTRRCAFLCRLLLCAFDFPFVVTAHAVLSSRFPLDRISVFPPSTIAVSPDIRTSLVKRFSVDPRRITVIENGIDTERFAPHPEKPHPFTVLTVSRLDRDCAHTARLLCEIAPLLTQKIGRPVRIVIAGGGNAMPELRTLSDTINKKLARPAIILTGKRTDVNRLLDTCNIFVGVSRAALEAMAAGKPVILSGDEGYLGILDERTLAAARDCNFCARGHAPASGAHLLHDLLYLAALSPSARTKLGLFGRETVRRFYSAEDMAKKTLAVYRRELERFRRSRRSDALICGYYGYGNCGDEMVLRGIIDRQLALTPDLRLSVLTANRYSPKGARRIDRYDPRSLVREMRNGGAFILGGGSLLQDVTSLRSLIYYLTLLSVAHAFALPTMLYANGLGPLTETSLALCRRVLGWVDIITLRDRDSYEAVRAMNLPRTRVVLGADPVLAEKAPKAVPPRKPPYLALFPRKIDSLDSETAIADGVAELAEQHGLDIVIVPMNHTEDHACCHRIAERLRQQREPHRRVVVSSSSPRAVERVISGASLVISERLHALIIAFRHGIPSVGINRDPKIASFLRETRLPKCVITPPPAPTFPQDLCHAASHALANPPSSAVAARLRTRALRDAHIANRLILRKS